MEAEFYHDPGDEAEVGHLELAACEILPHAITVGGVIGLLMGIIASQSELTAGRSRQEAQLITMRQFGRHQVTGKDT